MMDLEQQATTYAAAIVGRTFPVPENDPIEVGVEARMLAALIQATYLAGDRQHHGEAARARPECAWSAVKVRALIEMLVSAYICGYNQGDFEAGLRSTQP
jgi:hypothetical protein